MCTSRIFICTCVHLLSLYVHMCKSPISICTCVHLLSLYVHVYISYLYMYMCTSPISICTCVHLLSLYVHVYISYLYMYTCNHSRLRCVISYIFTDGNVSVSCQAVYGYILFERTIVILNVYSLIDMTLYEFFEV